ncbi:conserved hypothetical protein [Verticillium alfalfae VaMs.102]|uniref:Uncharacterized protein n=1 Tax=Verticillium alfalfae (strain VaMs.102 / ATCC MYA-4576 / FGSC 10136) TaxID=526221 RepID=C9SGQ6_VERA1|nr:conserved hypothetical protein [Verticillium alfalfae VaMs.102]EEY17551.1 conserved hypothetical protein [Verticillium alfalfae VaMs.102]
MLAGMPPIIPGGKIDPAMLPTSLGVTRELEPHYRKLKAEEEKLRHDLDAKQDKLRQGLAVWDRLELESKAWKTRVDFNEQSMMGLTEGPAF